MITIHSIHFDLSGWQLASESDGKIGWVNDVPDGLSLNFFPVPPDLPSALSAVQALRDFYRQAASEAGGAIVSVDALSIQDLEVIKTIFKFPQDPIGMTYLGSLTLPRAGFSFMVKVQCHEHGMTGLREATILDRLLASGQATVDEVNGHIQGWFQDPYDPTFEAPVLRSRADDEEYDAMFPDHPLSRARKHLSHIEATLTIDDDVRNSAPFLGLEMPQG